MSDKTKELDQRIKELENQVSEKEKLIAEQKEKSLRMASVSSHIEGDEKKAMRAFGCSHPSQLLKINTGDASFKHVPSFYKQIVRQLKSDVNNARFISQKFFGDKQDNLAGESEQVSRCNSIMQSNFAKNVLAPRLKAFGSTESGGGDEWVPTMIASQYIHEVELDFSVESKFKNFPMPSNPYNLPVQSGSTTAKIVAENAAGSAVNFTTGAISLSATKFIEYYVLPEELNQDSAPQIFQLAQQELMLAQIRAIEDCILNGDNDGTHIDSDTQAGASNLAAKAFKGLRREALANSGNGATTNFSGAAVTEANLSLMISRMKKLGVLPSQLCFFAGPQIYQQLRSLASVKTKEVFGDQATVLSGELAKIFGIPIVTSQFMREDLNASGVYDGTTTNKAGLILCNIDRFYVGTRSPIKMKIMEDLSNYDRWLMASYQRKDFKGHTQSATEVAVSYGYNIAL